MMLLPCIICGAELESAVSAQTADDLEVVNQPYRGTVFKSYGHYGSTVFDPVFHRQFLEITVCDACLVTRKDKVLHYTVIGHEAVKTEARPWNPDRE